MIYLDNAATTKPSLSAIEGAKNFISSEYFNPSALYKQGLNCQSAINLARDVILKALGASKSDYKVVFTGSGSESDNLAIFGAVKRGCFITDKGEHSAVYKSFLELEQRGNKVNFISLNQDGTACQEELFEFVKNNKVDFVSIVHVNNETGGINNVDYIAETIKKISPSTVFHVDGVQAFCKLPFRLSNYIDMYSISAHKINALKGVGALICKKKLNLKPIVYGGGQEEGVRSGTENVFGIKVFENAILEKLPKVKINYDNVKLLKQYVIDNLDKEIFEIISGENSSPYILNVSAKGLKGEVLMHLLEQKDIIVGNGSACSSRNRFSRVIEACGYKHDILDGVCRISFSSQNNLEEIKIFVQEINSEAKKLKGIMQ